MASIAVRNQTVPLNGVNYRINSTPNAKAGNGALTQAKDFADSAYGAYKLTDGVSKLFKESIIIAESAGNLSAAAALKGPGSVIGGMAGGFIAAHWVSSAIGVKDSIKAVVDNGPSCGRVESLVKDSLDFITSGCFTMINFVDAPVLKVIGTFADLTGDSIEVKQEACNLTLADDLLKTQGETGGVSADIHADLVAKKKLHFIGLVKAVVSVVGGIFAALAIILGAALVPAIVTASIGLVAITLTFVKHFFRENMDQNVKIERLVAPVEVISATTAGAPAAEVRA